MIVGRVPATRSAASGTSALAPSNARVPASRPLVPIWIAYLVAVVASGTAVAGDWFLPSVFAPSPFLLGALVVVAAALLGGLGPGLLATALCAAGISAPLVDTIGQSIVALGVQVGAFIAFGVLLAGLAGAWQHARSRARHSQETLFAVYRGLTEGVLCTDDAQQIVFANDAAARMLGFAPGLAAPGTVAAVTERYDLGDHGSHALPIASLLMSATDGTETRVNVRDRATGQEYWWAVHTIPLPRTAKGSPLASRVTLVRDITTQQHAEAAIATSERRFRSLIAHSADVFMLLDARGSVLFASPAISSLLGYRDDELRGTELYALVHPQDVGRATALVGSLRTATAPPTDLLRLRHQDGRWRWIEMTGSDLTGDPGVRATLVNLRDVTDRKRAEETVITNERRFHALLDQTTDAIFVANGDGNIVYTNPAAQRIFGYTPQPFVETDADMAIHPDDRAEVHAFFRALTTSAHTESAIVCRMRGQDETYRWVELAATNLLADPAIRGVIGTYRDITMTKRSLIRQQALSAVNARLTAADGDDDVIASSIIETVPQFAAGCAVDIRGTTGKLRRALTVIPEGCVSDPFATTPVAAYIARALITGRAARFVPITSTTAGTTVRPQANDETLSREERAVPAPLNLTMLVVPLVVRNVTLGAVTFAAPADMPFDDADQVIAEEIGGRLALALAYTRRVSDDRVIESRYRSLFGSITDAVAVVDEKGQVLEANPAFCALTGYTVAEIVQKALAAFVSPASSEGGEAMAFTTYTDAWEGVAVMVRKDAAPVSVEGQIVPVSASSTDSAASLSVWRAVSPVQTYQ